MPKQSFPSLQTPLRAHFFHLLRRFWLGGLLVIVCANLIAIGYIVLRGAHHRDDVQIRIETSAQITTQDPMVIRFTTPMQQSAVMNALQITPPQPYQTTWTDDGQQLTIVPDTPWQNATTYTIRLTTSAQSRTGRYLPQEWSAQVTTQRVVQIRQVLPPPNQVDVARDSIIVVRFGQQMVTQADVGVSLEQPPLQIFPLIGGSSTWLDSRTLAFQPYTLAPNQEYTITVPTQLTDVTGTMLQQSYTWRFRTMATRIERSEPAPDSQEIELTQSLVLTMTGQINETRLQQSIHVSPTITTELTITPLSSSQTRVDITPPLGWQSDTQYTVTLGGGDSDLAPFRTTFRTAAPLRLVARTPGDGVAVGTDGEVRFIFNALLDTNTITEAITISPAPVQPARISTTGRDIRITANWEVQVNPIIQISSALQSTSGISLTTPISTELRIDPRQAIATLPGTPGTIYDASTTSTFQLQIIPNRTAILRIYDVPVATLIRMLDMDVTNFLTIDPGRYNLPLLSQQELQSTENKAQISIDIMQGITTTPLSRIWLVQLISANGSQDIRLVRTQPATIHAISLPQYTVVGLHEQQAPQPNRSILLFQSGQLINQGVTDARGIWQTPTYVTDQQLVVIDPQQPVDAHTLTLLPIVENNEVQLLIDRTAIERGEQLNVLMSRQERNGARNAVVQIRAITGEVLSEQKVTFDDDVAMTSTRIRAPNQLSAGIYIVELVLDGRIARQPVLVHGLRTSSLTVTHQQHTDQYIVVIRDQYGQAIANQSVLWVSATQYGHTQSSPRGEVVIPVTPNLTTLLVDTDSGSVVTHILPTMANQQLTLTHTNWADSDQPTPITIQLRDTDASVANRIIQIDVQNTDRQVVQRQQIITDANGQAVTTVVLPKGEWQLVATTDEIQTTTTLWVGMSRTDDMFVSETDALARDQTPRWRRNQIATDPLLIAQLTNQQLIIDWAQQSDTGVVSSVPVSQTGVLHSVISTAGQAYQHSEQQVYNPQCPTNVPIEATARDKQMSIEIGYMPNSRFLFNVYDITTHKLIAERINMRSDDSDAVLFQRPDTGTTQFIHVSLMIINDTCQLSMTKAIPVVRTQRLTLDAPPVVRVGDIIGVTLHIYDNQPGQYSRFVVSPEGLQIVDTLPQFDVISNQQGTATRTWHYRVQDAQARLSIESNQSPTLVWQPTVIVPPITYTNDGFVLEGTTSIEQGSIPPSLLDIVNTRQQLQQALSKTPYDAGNPSQIAHRIWHTASPTDQLILMQQLMQLQLPNGAWGWVGSQTADPLITADVIIALTNAQQSMPSNQGALRYLQQQVQNPQLSPSIRAMLAYALSLSQQPPVAELLALSRTPNLLGNEGLAALILGMPAEYTYTIPPLVAELVQRAQSAPRGLWWGADPATASLHSQENVNALIYRALAMMNLATSERIQLGTQLLSARGVNGWSDSISNGRIWSQQRILLPNINADTAISIISDTGQIVHMGMMSPAQAITFDGLLLSDDDVLVGIARPRNTPTPTGEAVIWQQLYRDDGTLLPNKTTLTRGEEITVRVSMAFFSSIPHISISDPQSTLSTIMAPPINDAGMSLHNAPHAIILHASVDTAKIIHYIYRIRMDHMGQSILEPIQIRDGSGTLHAQSQAVMVSVVAP